MKVSTELVVIESGGLLDAKLATAGFYVPLIANAALPAATGVEGMVAYDTNANKLVFSNGTAWEEVTST